MMNFYISGHFSVNDLPQDWREHLAQLLGSRPRRIGIWAELGLYGALRCMADAGESTLPPDALLMLTSRHGTYMPGNAALVQMQEDLPMPLTFLQTQPSQLLALLAARLDWRGSACFFADATLPDLLRLASAQAGDSGVLLGCVDELAGGSTHWLRFRRGVAQSDISHSSQLLDEASGWGFPGAQ